MNRRSISVLIPAAGSSSRFWAGDANYRQSKIYTFLAHRPLITHVLRVFDAIPSVREVIVAIRRGDQKRFEREILTPSRFDKPLIIVWGGSTRAESVFNCLKRVSRASTHVCVHDAARPLIRKAWVNQLIRCLRGYDGIVLGRRVVPTVKEIRPENMEIARTLDRTCLFEAQTPQLFTKKALLRAYRLLGRRAFRATDDASLVEAIGGRLRTVIHSDANLKVTTYQDLVMIQNMLEQKAAAELPSLSISDGKDRAASPLRFGLGFDRHRLVPNRPFYLGGVRIHSKVGPLGHSDGDPLLHAVTDGILGAIGTGDMGDFFPDSSPRWKDVRSDHFLKKAIQLAMKRNFHPIQVDATIFLDDPRLGSVKRKIQAKLSRLLSLSIDQVGVKAKTLEGLGPEEVGNTVSCHALVVLQST